MFVSAFLTPFMKDDLDILERNFTVRKRIGHGVLHVFRIASSVFQTDIVFCWFGSVYAAVAVAFARFSGGRAIVCLAGVDVSKEPEYNYGIWLTPWKARLLRYALRSADAVLVVAPFMKEDAKRLAKYDGANITYFPAGIDGTYWKPSGVKQPVVLTVAVANDRTNVIRKGLDILIATAKLMPTVPFTVIGTDPERVAEFHPPQNITFLGKLPREQLLPHYQRAKVYCHPARREGMPNTLLEAMACGCLPVATDTCGHPVAIGGEGILVPVADQYSLSEALVKALMTDDETGLRARTRIISLFAKETHERELLRMIHELAKHPIV